MRFKATWAFKNSFKDPSEASRSLKCLSAAAWAKWSWPEPWLRHWPGPWPSQGPKQGLGQEGLGHGGLGQRFGQGLGQAEALTSALAQRMWFRFGFSFIIFRKPGHLKMYTYSKYSESFSKSLPHYILDVSYLSNVLRIPAPRTLFQTQYRKLGVGQLRNIAKTLNSRQRLQKHDFAIVGFFKSKRGDNLQRLARN